jgi:hypothetical protein
MTDKISYSYVKKRNYWAFATIVLGIALIISIFIGMRPPTNTITGNVVGQKVIDFANSQGANAKLIGVETEGELYKVLISIENEEFPVYVTKDGKNLVPSLIPLEMEIIPRQATPQTQEPQQIAYSQSDLIKLKEFNDCLGEKGLKVYGANWCGWTKRLVVETLGGYDIASAVYIECTENEKICSDEGIQGYPTIKINGQPYNGQRTLKDLGSATSCPVPQLEGSTIQTASSDVQCS